MNRRLVLFALIASILLATVPAANALKTQTVVGSAHTIPGAFSNGTLDDVDTFTAHGGGNGALAPINRTWNNQSASDVAPDSTQSITVDGPFDPRGPSATDRPTLEVTGNRDGGLHSVYSETDRHPNLVSDGTTRHNGSITFPNPPDYATTLEIYVDASNNDPSNQRIDIYGVNEGADGVYQEGALLKDDWAPANSNGWQTIDISDTDITNSNNFTIEFVLDNHPDTNNNLQVEIDDKNQGSNTGWSGNYWTDQGVVEPYAPRAKLYSDPAAVGVSTDVTSGAAHAFGDFSNGQTKTTEFNISKDATQLEFNGTGGKIDFVLRKQDRTNGDNGTYISANHTGVDRVVQGFTNLSLSSASATVTWEGNSGSGWTQLDKSTHAAGGNKTVSLASGHDKYRVNVTLDRDDGSVATSTAQLHDEGIQFEARQPEVDNSSMTPRGELGNATPTFRIDVNDSDFQTSQGDSVTAELFVDNKSKGTDTLSSNGTASVSLSKALDGGNHTYNWTTTDSYGLSNTSLTRDITVPAEITFVNESNASELVDNAKVKVSFFSQDPDSNLTVVERTASDGNVSLDGLDVSQRMVVEVQADNWTSRTIVIESIFEQDTVYLFNNSKFATSNVTFTIEDRTGFYPPESTVIFVERAINKSNETKWRVIGGDEVGPAGYNIELATETRFRLSIKNDDGDVKDLGHVNTQGDLDGTIQQLTITSADNPLAGSGRYQWNATFENRDDQGKKDRIRFDINITAADTKASDFRVIIHEMGNESNEIHNQSYGKIGSLTVYQDLTTTQENESWIVNWTGTLNGETITGEAAVGRTRYISTFPLAPEWQERGAIGFMLVVAGLGSAFNVGVVALLLGAQAGLFYFLGVLPAGVGAGAILLAVVLGIVWLGKGAIR